MLKARHIQLIGIGGTIGTALFVRNIIILQAKIHALVLLKENPLLTPGFHRTVCSSYSYAYRFKSVKASSTAARAHC